MDIYWAHDRLDLMRTFAKEIVGLQPDVILANSTPVTGALKRETLTIPIVFAGSPTQSAQALWRAWRGPVGISPD